MNVLPILEILLGLLGFEHREISVTSEIIKVGELIFSEFYVQKKAQCSWGIYVPGGVIFNRNLVGSLKGDKGLLISVFGKTTDIESFVSRIDAIVSNVPTAKNTSEPKNNIYVRLRKNNESRRDVYMNVRYEPNDMQKKIIDEIVDVYNEKKCVTVLISGPTNIGKTTISILLANRMKCILHPNYDFTNPSSGIGMFFEHYPGDKRIMSTDEVDVPILNAYSGALNKRRYGAESPSVYDKRTLNDIFDSWHNFGVNGVWIMTSNKTMEQIQEETDPSILRMGRITLYYNLYECDSSPITFS